MAQLSRALVSLTLLATGLTSAAQASSADVAGASEDGRQVLGEVNVITGDATGYVEVSLPSDVTIDAREPNKPDARINADIKIQGSGRFVGIALIPDPFSGVRMPHHYFLAGRFNGCDEEGCEPGGRFRETMDSMLSSDRRPLKIEAGDYRLYLLADGAPVRAAFRLHGLSGHSSFEVTQSASMDVQTTEDRIDTDVNGGRVWSSGSSFAGGQVGFSMSWLDVEASDFTGMEIDVCQYNAFEPPPEQIAYGPHCSSLTPLLGSGGSVTFDGDIEENRFSLLASFGYHDNQDGTYGTPNLSGQHGLGASIRSPQTFEVQPLRSFFLTIK